MSKNVQKSHIFVLRSTLSQLSLLKQFDIILYYVRRIFLWKIDFFPNFHIFGENIGIFGQFYGKNVNFIHKNGHKKEFYEKVT